MRTHNSAAAAVHACTQIVGAAAILSITTACTDSGSATSGDDAELLSLSARNSRNTIVIWVRDSSLTIGDTARITVAGRGQRSADGSTRFVARFRSSDTTVASVDADGVIHARGAGSSVVVVRTLAGAGMIAVSVAPAAVPASTAADTIATLSPTPAPGDSTTLPGTPATPAPPAAAPPAAVPPVVVAPPAIVTPSSPGTLPSFTAPQLPQASVDISMPSVSRSIRIAAGDATGLQAALNAAVGGDEIVLADGGVYAGPFHLPNRAGGGTVVLRSATIPVGARTRITPSQAGSLATLVTNSVFPALTADDGAHGWRVIGVKMQLADGAVDNYGIVTLGSGVQTSASQFPRDIVLDRVFVNGSPTGNTSRCVSLNGNALAVIDSWLAECHARGRDAQAIGGWTGSGPFLIENNRLEGSGQAIMFGGADPLVPNVTPADITIRRNHLFKPLSWSGGRWTVKATFELKHAERVLFEANVLENHWADAQNGFAILMQASAQNAPWSIVRDVTLRQNLVRNSTSGINLLAAINQAGSTLIQPSRRILVRENAFIDVGRDPISAAAGRFVQLLLNLEDVSLINNTFFSSARASNDVIFDGAPTVRLLLAANVFSAASYGILGSGFGEGQASINRFMPDGVMTSNVITGVYSSLYSGSNAFPTSLTQSDFAGFAQGNFSLSTQFQFSSVNGVRAGVDGSALAAATSGVIVQP